MTYPGPTTSSTYKPGMVVNETPYGNTTNAQWVQIAAEYWASRWAHGDRTVPEGWVSAQFGEPDASDADGVASPRTLLAFTRYFSQYTPGKDPYTDQVLPYVPPGPNDYIEDPTVTAAKIASQQFDRNFEENQRQFNLNYDQRERDAARTAFNQAFQNELQRASIEAGIWSTQTEAELSKYNTQAGIYTSNEANRSGNLREAGSLAAALQGMYDARTENAIALHANPGNFVERELATRALAAPKYSNVPGYQNVDALGEVIRKLIDYQPGAAPVAPTTAPPPTIPTQAGFTPPAGALATPAAPAASTMPAPVAPAPTTPAQPPAGNQVAQAAAYSGIPYASVAGLKSGDWALQTTGSLGPSNRDDYTDFEVFDANRNPIAAGSSINASTPVWLRRLAEGGTTSDRMFIAGDPQADGQANPEIIKVTGDNVKSEVIPLKNVLNGGYKADTGNWMDAVRASGTPAGEAMKRNDLMRDRYMAAKAAQPISYGNDQLGGVVSPSAGTTMRRSDMFRRRGNTGYSDMMNRDKSRWQSPAGQRFMDRIREVLQGGGINAYAYGTGTNTAPQVTLRSYEDSVYQNLPSLKYLSGFMDEDDYNTISTGYAAGAFGERLPEAGRINYGRYLDLAKDPVSLAMVASQYVGGSRNLAAEAARAKARAPFGSAVQTSLIRT